MSFPQHTTQGAALAIGPLGIRVGTSTKFFMGMRAEYLFTHLSRFVLGLHADFYATVFVQGPFIHSPCLVLLPMFIPTGLSGTRLDVGTGFDSASLLRRHMLSGSIGPSGLVVIEDNEPPSRQASLSEASALLRRVGR